MRLSNFLMWQAAYSELVFLPIYWPDFDRQALQLAIEFLPRPRQRFGGSARASKLRRVDKVKSTS